MQDEDAPPDTFSFGNAALSMRQCSTPCARSQPPALQEASADQFASRRRPSIRPSTRLVMDSGVLRDLPAVEER
jgi:hypothetical protein